MQYTPEQYGNMVDHIVSFIMEAELHNGRVIKRLEDNDAKLRDMHNRLEVVLLQAIGISGEIEEELNARSPTHHTPTG